MTEKDEFDLAFKAEVQKKVLANCISNLHKYFKSRNWEILASKFKTLGFVLPNDLISCKICEENISGYYFYKQKKIVLCANNVLDNEFPVVLTEQMISAFDDARAEIDSKNPAHVACSAIRGANLSGRCTQRSKFALFKDYGKYIKCVRDRSVETILKNKALGLKTEDAEEFVLDVWDTCFYDYEPYTLEEHRKAN